MIRGIIGSLKTSMKRGLLTKNKYTFYGFNNQVPKFDRNKDYYKTLGVSKHSSQTQIKKSFYQMARQYHPDSNPGHQAKFKEVNEAYTVLSDSKVKRQYDSARAMKGFTRKMGSKADQGNWDFRDYQAQFQSLSPEEQQQLRQELNRRVRKVVVGLVAMIVILPFITRRNHRYWIVNQGQLIPVEFQGGLGGGTAPPPGMTGPYGQVPYPQQGPGSYGHPMAGNPAPYGNQGPYSQVVQNIAPPPNYYQQSNLQPGYRGPTPPQ